MIEIQDDAIIKDGEQIGTFEGSTVSLFKAVGPPIKGAIKKALGLDAVTFSVCGVTAKAVPHPDDIPSLSDEELLAELQRRNLALNPSPKVEEVAEITPPDEDEELYELLKLRPDLSFEEAAKISRHRRRVKALNRLTIAVASGRIPEPPKRDPAMGEKDPDYVAWIRAYATPDEFRTIYGDAKLPTREQFKSGWVRQIGMKEVDDA